MAEEKPVTGGEYSSADRAGGGLEPQGARPAKPVVAGRARAGMFGVSDSGDTSG